MTSTTTTPAATRGDSRPGPRSGRAAGLLSSMLFFGAIGAFFLTLSLHLQTGTGRTAWQTGLVMLPYAIGSILTSGLGVALAAKAGRALLISGSLTLAASQADVVPRP